MQARALEAARRSGLVPESEPLLVMLSGGADSVCLLDVARRLGARVSALHVNYGLRAAAEQDESHCRALCERLGVELTVERAWLPEGGNVQAHARDARYRLAERVARGDYAAAHTASDQAETVLYRLAASPGRRALLGMEPRRGRLVRPLLEATREDTRAHCREAGLAWCEDESNEDPRFARARVRHGLLAALREVAPEAEATVAETARQLREEEEVLRAAAASALETLGGGPVVDLAALRALPRATARLVLRTLAERAAGRPMALAGERVEAVLALGEGGGTSALDVGGGLRAVCEYGMLRLDAAGAPPAPEPVDLPVPGTARFGSWEVRAGGLGEVAVAVSGPLVVRAWREGDRIRPAGLGGSKTLADLFSDRKVPRELRRTLPVVVSGEDVVWVAGVAVDERFAVQEGAAGALGLSASLSRP
jgi:tRNA(Ile)-lysidine synthase